MQKVKIFSEKEFGKLSTVVKDGIGYVNLIGS
jgi:hypothetical protein